MMFGAAQIPRPSYFPPIINCSPLMHDIMEKPSSISASGLLPTFSLDNWFNSGGNGLHFRRVMVMTSSMSGLTST